MARLFATLFLTIVAATAAAQDLSLIPVGVYQTGVFDEGATEIAAFDPMTDRIFSVNGFTGAIEVLDLSDPANPTLLFAIDITPWGAAANHVDVHDGILAAAIEADPKQAPGRIVFFETSGSCAHLSDVAAGALPDMCIFTPDGRYVLAACEGEPDDDYLDDPEGSITVVDLLAGPALPVVHTASFAPFNARIDALRSAGVRIFGPGATVAQDLEPEYIAIAADGATAWATCQEANAVAVIDVATATVTAIVPLGTKDHAESGNGLDASDRDDAIRVENWPVLGFYLPDAIVSYEVDGQTYLITANEGDTRDYDGFGEEARVANLLLDPTVFPNAATLQAPANLGRLKTPNHQGDLDGDGDIDVIHSFGARSFTIWDAMGNPVFDSGDEIEQITASLLPEVFNSDNTDNTSFDNRSDDKGPEPEGVAVAEFDGRWFAFIGLERLGGVMVYDVTNPSAATFVTYVTTRDFAGDPELGTAGGLGPEGLRVITAADSPSGHPLLLVSNEVSGSIDVLALTGTVQNEAPGEEDVLADLPGTTRLLGVFPNPFNPVTTVAFALARGGEVRLDIVDVRGRLVTTLVSGVQTAGEHQVLWAAGGQPSGAYFAVLRTADYTEVKRMALVK